MEDEDENVTVEISIYGDYSAYGQIQKYIEEKGYELVSGGFEQIPNVDLKEVTPEQRATLDKLTGLLEDDEDVTNVYTTLAPPRNPCRRGYCGPRKSLLRRPAGRHRPLWKG